MILKIIILSLWGGGSAAGLLCAGLLARRGLFARYRAIGMFWIFEAVQCAWLLTVLLTRGGRVYTSAWRLLQPVDIALSAILVIEAAILQGKHFPKIGAVASLVLLIFTGLSALAVLGTAGIGVGEWELDASIAISRHFALICLAVLESSRLFFNFFPIKVIRENVRWHVFILEILFAGQVIYYALSSLGGAACSSRTIAAQFIGMGVPLICNTLWSLKLTRAGESYAPLPVGDPREVTRLRKRSRARTKLLWALLRKHWSAQY